jgi:hypothetical protein
MDMAKRQKKLSNIFVPWMFAWRERKTRKARQWCELMEEQRKEWEKVYNITEFRSFEEWLYRPFGSLNVLHFDYIWAYCVKNELDGCFGWGPYVKGAIRKEPEKKIKCECGSELKIINRSHIKTKKHQNWLNSH